MSELWFLTLYGDLSLTVVYAGAAPGTHTCYLAKLFPKHYFILIDPSKFVLRKDIEEVNDRIEVHNKYFDD
jgi:hypothetical protein